MTQVVTSRRIVKRRKQRRVRGKAQRFTALQREIMSTLKMKLLEMPHTLAKYQQLVRVYFDINEKRAVVDKAFTKPFVKALRTMARKFGFDYTVEFPVTGNPFRWCIELWRSLSEDLLESRPPGTRIVFPPTP